mgnify:CR=1 FL=1
MDENCNDYYYTCANCGNTIYSENEWVGRCDCGQVIKSLRFDDWNPDFLKKNNLKDPRNLFYKLLHYYLRRTNKYRKTFIIRAIDKMFRILGC